MPRDPQIYSVLSILVMAVLAEGVRVSPGASPDAPEFEQAVRISDFCQRCLDNLHRPLSDVLYELVEGMLKLGHKAAEQLYDYRTFDPEVGPQLALIDLKTKPHEATAFVVDAFNNVLGLLYVRPGRPMPSLLPQSSETSGGAARL